MPSKKEQMDGVDEALKLIRDVISEGIDEVGEDTTSPVPALVKIQQALLIIEQMERDANG